MKKLTIDEIKSLLDDFKVLIKIIVDEDENPNQNINDNTDWIDRLKNDELKQESIILCSQIDKMGLEKALENFDKRLRDRYVSRIDFSIFSEETKNVIYDMFNVLGCGILTEGIGDINDKAVLMMVLEEVKETPWWVEYVWSNINKELQEQSSDLLTSIISWAEKNSALAEIWINTSPKVQIENAELLETVINGIKFPSQKVDIWINTCLEVQIEKSVIFKKVVEDLEDDQFENVWINTHEEVQNENANLFLNHLKQKAHRYDCEIGIKDLLEGTSIKVQLDTVSEIIKMIAKEIIEEKRHFSFNNFLTDRLTSNLELIWKNTNKEVQRQIIVEIIENSTKDDFYIVEIIWKSTDWNVQQEKFEYIIEKEKENTERLAKIWANTNGNVQKEHLDLLDKLINYAKENTQIASIFWKKTDPNIQKNKLESIIEEFKENSEVIATIWTNTDKNVQKLKAYLLDRIIDYAQNDPKSLAIIWSKTDPNIQKNKLESKIKKFKENSEVIAMIWSNTDKNVQKEKAYLLDRIIDYAQNDPKSLAIIWSNTDINVQKEKAYLLETIIIDYLKDNPLMAAIIWSNTYADVQDEKVEDIIKKIKDNPNFLGVLWRNTDTVVQQKRIKRIFELIKEETNKQEASVRIKIIIENSARSIMKDIWNLLSIEEQKEYFETIIDKITKDSKACQDLPEILETIDKNIDTERLSQILTMKDNEYLNKYVVKEILIKNIGNKSINIKSVNEEIEKIFKIFFTNNLPETFKIFEFFKFHPNHEEGNNDNLYKGKTQEERDKIILSDLIESSLDSNNNQFRNFLELLYNGNLAYIKYQNGYELDELDKSFLSSYSDTLISLYNLLKSDKIKNENNYLQHIEEIYSKLKLDKTKDIGNELLIQFFTQLGFDFSKYGSNKDKIIEELLSYTEEKRKEAIDRNRKNTEGNNLLEERRFNKRNIN